MILVTGAAGKTGRAVTRALQLRGASVRALVHHQSQVATLKTLGASEVIIGDFLKPEDLKKAVEGVHAVYYICPNVNPSEVEIGRQLIALAKAARVTHFVYHSVLHPQIEAMPHHWNKMRVEEELFASGLPFTILQPAAYMQNILGGWSSIVRDGVYPIPYAPQTRLTMVDLEEAAEAAALVLTQPEHINATYELAAPGFLSQVEVAHTLSQVLGKNIAIQVIPRTIWAENALASGMDAYAVETLIKMFEYYERYHFSGNPQVLSWLLKRNPATFADFLRKHLGRAQSN
ncbi:MAG: NmrA family NAD(P)-binding protein [Anaerolineae bacterium]|nr:NmrA family NAD(P)-binding protein [Anaerolineae bacterium]